MSIQKIVITPFIPFSDESATLQVGELTIENRTDRVSFFGSAEITRDKLGLALALELKGRIDQIVEVLKSEHLPEKLEVLATTEVANPFTNSSNQ